MNKLLSTVGLIVIGLVVLTAATLALTRLLHALPPVILVAGIILGALRVVWAATRRW